MTNHKYTSLINVVLHHYQWHQCVCLKGKCWLISQVNSFYGSYLVWVILMILQPDWWHQTITCTVVDISLIGFCVIHVMKFPRVMLKISITKVCSKLRPRDKELKGSFDVLFSVILSHGITIFYKSKWSLIVRYSSFYSVTVIYPSHENIPFIFYKTFYHHSVLWPLVPKQFHYYLHQWRKLRGPYHTYLSVFSSISNITESYWSDMTK